MAFEIHFHERCGKCGDIRKVLDSERLDYKEYFFPPQTERVKEIVGNGNEPVLVPERETDEPVVGHESILKWLTESHMD